jgi:hypothetical protein
MTQQKLIELYPETRKHVSTVKEILEGIHPWLKPKT